MLLFCKTLVSVGVIPIRTLIYLFVYYLVPFQPTVLTSFMLQQLKSGNHYYSAAFIFYAVTRDIFMRSFEHGYGCSRTMSTLEEMDGWFYKLSNSWSFLMPDRYFNLIQCLNISLFSVILFVSGNCRMSLQFWNSYIFQLKPWTAILAMW